MICIKRSVVPVAEGVEVIMPEGIFGNAMVSSVSLREYNVFSS